MVRSRTSKMDWGLRFLQRRGVSRGFQGASRTWFWIAIAAWGLRRVRRWVGSEPELVWRGEVKPGQAIRIDHSKEVYGTTKR
jgi:hypothetical protein